MKRAITFIVATAALLIVCCNSRLDAVGACPDTPTCGGESLDYFLSDHYTGAPISDGSVLPVNSWVRLDAYATAYGQCATEDWSSTPPPGTCIPGPVYQRTVNHVSYGLVASTSGSLNGSYSEGATFCVGANGLVAYYNVLDSRTSQCPGGEGQMLFFPGIYTFYFTNFINNLICCDGVCPASVAKNTTVYAAETDMSDCSASAGVIGVATGIVETSETDFSLPGLMPIEFTRYYNSKAAFAGSREELRRNLGSGLRYPRDRCPEQPL